MTDDSPTEETLWDVMEEHFDEAQYACEELDAQLSNATLALDQVEADIETRLLAHTDGLVLGGEPVARRLLLTGFDPKLEPDHFRTVAAAFALMCAGQSKLAEQGLLAHDARIRSAALRGVELAGAAPLEAWAFDRFREHADPELRATLLRIAAPHLEQAAIAECLNTDASPVLLAAALQVAMRNRAQACLAQTEALLEHDDADVRRYALRTALALGSTQAWAVCCKQAWSTESCDTESLLLFSCLGTATQTSQLAELVRERESPTALFAIGFSGNRELMPLLLDYLEQPDRLLAKLAAQSIHLIAGIDTQADDYTLPDPPPSNAPRELPPAYEDDEALAGLPAFEDDDLDANLVPASEEAMPDPDANAVRREWDRIQGAFSPSQRYVLGHPLSVSTLLDALEHARGRVRHVLGLALAIRTGGRCQLDTTSLVRDQRVRLAEFRALQLRSFERHFGSA